jgi:hypothetical protein
VTTSLRSAPRANFIAGRLLGLRVEVKARCYSAVRRRALVDPLDSGTRDGPRDTWGGYNAVEDAARVPRVSVRRGTSGLYLEVVGIGPTRTPRRRSALRAAQPVTAGRPARQRRSRARPGCFATGQLSFDRDFLQNIELCDKNGRYESCR